MAGASSGGRESCKMRRKRFGRDKTACGLEGPPEPVVCPEDASLNSFFDMHCISSHCSKRAIFTLLVILTSLSQ